MLSLIDQRVTVQYDVEFRGIAQSGSAPALGAGCRGFKSLYPEQAGSPAPVAHLDRASAF